MREDRGSRKPFKYKSRSPEQYRKRAEQSSGMFDKWHDEKFERYGPKEGEHEIRVLPPTWPGAEHYAHDIYLHYGVGPDNQSYLCLAKMKGEDCPVCEVAAKIKEEASEALRNGEKQKAESLDKQAKQLKPKKRALMWIINRKEPEKGPILYDMPWTLDKAFTDRMLDKKTGELLEVDSPEEGYDLYFKREGSKINTTYIGETIARNPSPLHDKQARADKWLAFVAENTIPDVLRFFDYDHINKAFNAEVGAEDDDEDDKKDAKGKKSRRDEDEDDRPRNKGSKKDDDSDEDDDADDRPSKNKSKKDEDEDDDEDEKPRGRKPSKDEDSDDDDDDDEDDKPKKSKRERIDDDEESLDDDPDDKSKKKSKSKDEDEDEDDADDDPPKKGKKSRDEDDSDDDDDEDDAPKGKSKKSSRDEDEDEDDDEKPAKKKSKPSKDDDDDIPF